MENGEFGMRNAECGMGISEWGMKSKGRNQDMGNTLGQDIGNGSTYLPDP